MGASGAGDSAQLEQEHGTGNLRRLRGHLRRHTRD